MDNTSENIALLVSTLRDLNDRIATSFPPPIAISISGSPPILDTIADLKAAVDSHEQWLKSKDKGQRLDLSTSSLSRETVESVVWRERDLRQASFGTCDVGGLDFTDSDLTSADFEHVPNLEPTQFGGAILWRAKLPPLFSFTQITTVEEMSKNCGKYFVGTLSASCYVALTAFSTTDVALLADNKTTNLPIVDVGVPIVDFFFTVPILLIAIAIFFWLSLQLLWDTLAKLPAQMVNRDRVDDATYPWIVNSLARIYSKELKDNLTTLDKVLKKSVVYLAYGAIPTVLVVVWIRCLPRHDTRLTFFNVVSCVVCTWLSIRYQILQADTLSRNRFYVNQMVNPLGAYDWPRRSFMISIMKAAVVVCIWQTISYFAMCSPLLHTLKPVRQLMPITLRDTLSARGILSIFGIRSTADLERCDVSTRPTSAASLDSQEKIQSISGASLVGRDLQHANMRSAYLVNADMRRMNLSDADLEYASLLGAQVERFDGQAFLDVINDGQYSANDVQALVQIWSKSKSATVFNGTLLNHADLSYAQCSGLDFSEVRSIRGADFSNGMFIGANFDGIHFYHVNLSDANLAGCSADAVQMKNSNLSDIDMSHAVLRKAQLFEANLNRAYLLDSDISNADLAWATLTNADLRYANLSYADMRYTDLTHADLSGVDLTHADLTDATLVGTKAYCSQRQALLAAHANVTKVLWFDNP